MILGDIDSAICIVVDRYEVRRGRQDGGKAVDLSVFLGPIGIHLYWPGLGASFVARAAG